MSFVTILTQRYKQDLHGLNLHCYTLGKGLFAARCARDSINIDALALLLERIVILGHPVYKYSPRLADMALELRRTEAHQTELARFIQENDLIHLEGYAAFRMSDYRNKLDMVMYCIIKKLKLSDSLL